MEVHIGLELTKDKQLPLTTRGYEILGAKWISGPRFLHLCSLWLNSEAVP